MPVSILAYPYTTDYFIFFLQFLWFSFFIHVIYPRFTLAIFFFPTQCDPRGAFLYNRERSFLLCKKESCKAGFSACGGSQKRHLPFRRSAIPAERFYITGNEVSCDIKNSRFGQQTCSQISCQGITVSSVFPSFCPLRLSVGFKMAFSCFFLTASLFYLSSPGRPKSRLMYPMDFYLLLS